MLEQLSTILNWVGSSWKRFVMLATGASLVFAGMNFTAILNAVTSTLSPSDYNAQEILIRNVKTAHTLPENVANTTDAQLWGIRVFPTSTTEVLIDTSDPKAWKDLGYPLNEEVVSSPTSYFSRVRYERGECYIGGFNDSLYEQNPETTSQPLKKMIVSCPILNEGSVIGDLVFIYEGAKLQQAIDIAATVRITAFSFERYIYQWYEQSKK